MSSFTPGPWVFAPPIGAEHAEVRDRDGRRIAVTIGGYPMRTKTEDANTRLIAAAPDMYDIILDIAGYKLLDGEYPLEAEVLNKMADVLAKIRGEE